MPHHPFAIKVDIVEMTMSQENTTLACVDNKFIGYSEFIVIITGYHRIYSQTDHRD